MRVGAGMPLLREWIRDGEKERVKFQTFVNIFGEVAVGLQHAMTESAHAKFLSLFEDRDEDGVYELRKHLVKLSELLGIEFSELSGRFLGSMIGDEAEFEIETPIHLTGDAETVDDIEVSVKAPRFLRSQSHVKIRIKFKQVPPTEGWKRLQDKVDELLLMQLRNLHAGTEGEE